MSVPVTCAPIVASKANSAFGYVFPAVRGIQAGREFYVSTCALRLVPRLFQFTTDDLPVEARAQRTFNKARAADIARYIAAAPTTYVLAALVVSIDSAVRFDPAGTGDQAAIGRLHVPMDARFIIEDGQHRREAIELAVRDNPALADEAVSVVFLPDPGLRRSQAAYQDLNRSAARPARPAPAPEYRQDPLTFARLIVLNSPLLRDTVDMDHSTLSPRSRSLFTLTAIATATANLVQSLPAEAASDPAATAKAFWTTLVTCFPEWSMVHKRELAAGEVRERFLHSHGVVLQALARAANALIRRYPRQWARRLEAIRQIDWARTNQMWEGRIMSAGRVQKGTQSVLLAAAVIKRTLGLPLSLEEQQAESQREIAP